MSLPSPPQFEYAVRISKVNEPEMSAILNEMAQMGWILHTPVPSGHSDKIIYHFYRETSGFQRYQKSQKRLINRPQ